MYRLKQRIERLITELRGLFVQTTVPITGIQVRKGKLTFPCDVTKIADGFDPYDCGDVWSGENCDDYALFRFNVAIPELQDGQECYLTLTTNQSGGHNMVRPQALFFIGNEAVQGLDTNHENVRVTELAGKGEQSFYIYAYSGMPGKTPYGAWVDMNIVQGVTFHASIQIRDRELTEYYFNIRTPFVYLKQWEENSPEYQKVLNSINDSLSLVDFREPHSDAFYQSIKKANQYIKETLYTGESGYGNATLVGHTHIDLAWLWRYEHTVDKAVRSFATEVKLLNEYDNHRFMSSQAQLYEFVKHENPELFQKIKALVAEGKWEPEGAMWVEPDMNLVSGESIVKQILYGKKFFKDEFGVDCKILWLPDVFGYTAALPQILKKSGVKYFMTSKVACNERNRFPYDTFAWKGIDGSEVLAHCSTYLCGAYNPNIEGGDILPSWNRYLQKDINDDILVPFGFADGGGGVTEEQVETLKRLESGIPGVPRVKIGTAGEYFERLDQKVSGHKRLPTLSGEIYFENHRGTYTSMARMKKKNRQCEFLYSNAQWLWAMANVFENMPFPREQFEKGIKHMLLNQFHDVLPGTSIYEVYEDADKLYDEAFAIGEKISKDALGAFKLKESHDKMTVLNPFSEQVSGYVVHDGKYKFVADVPAKGYATYSADGTAPEVPVTVSGNVIENQYYVLTWNDAGEISSLYDKRAERQCFIDGKPANRLRIYEDKSIIGIGDHIHNEDNWNLEVYYTEHEYEMSKPEKVYLLEADEEHAVVRCERRYMQSTIIQDTIVYARSPRIDFKTEIDWKEHSQVLKADFPVDVNTTRATYETQFGYLERSTVCNNSWDEAKFEVCGHKWADISDGGYGMALMNDCKYGYSAKDSTLTLTLLRCGCSPNPEADKEKHQFTYSILPHSGDIRDAEVVKEAYILNNPLAVVEGVADGKAVPESFSLFECNGAVLDTIKPAEDGDGLVLRFYEPYNCSGKVRVQSGKKIKKAIFTDLLENAIDRKDPEYRENEISFDMKPFEVITLRVWAE